MASVRGGGVLCRCSEENRFILFSQMTKLAKRLKKEKVNMDIVNFGEDVR